jgi:hypothetical protein
MRTIGRHCVGDGQLVDAIAERGLDRVAARVFDQRVVVLVRDDAGLGDEDRATLRFGGQLQVGGGVAAEVGGLHGDVAGVDVARPGVSRVVEDAVHPGAARFARADGRHRQAFEPRQRPPLVGARHGAHHADVRTFGVVRVDPVEGVPAVHVVDDAVPRGANADRPPGSDAGDAADGVRPGQVGRGEPAVPVVEFKVRGARLPHLHLAAEVPVDCDLPDPL